MEISFPITSSYITDLLILIEQQEGGKRVEHFKRSILHGAVVILKIDCDLDFESKIVIPSTTRSVLAGSYNQGY